MSQGDISQLCIEQFSERLWWLWWRQREFTLTLVAFNWEHHFSLQLVVVVRESVLPSPGYRGDIHIFSMRIQAIPALLIAPIHVMIICKMQSARHMSNEGDQCCNLESQDCRKVFCHRRNTSDEKLGDWLDWHKIQIQHKDFPSLWRSSCALYANSYLRNSSSKERLTTTVLPGTRIEGLVERALEIDKIAATDSMLSIRRDDSWEDERLMKNDEFDSLSWHVMFECRWIDECWKLIPSRLSKLQFGQYDQQRANDCRAPVLDCQDNLYLCQPRTPVWSKSPNHAVIFMTVDVSLNFMIWRETDSRFGTDKRGMRQPFACVLLRTEKPPSQISRQMDVYIKRFHDSVVEEINGCHAEPETLLWILTCTTVPHENDLNIGMLTIKSSRVCSSCEWV